MLRITEGTATDGDATVLYLEGQVVGPWLVELRRCCELVLATSRRLIIDLENVSFIDREAASLFRELADRDVPLTNCTPFVAEQLKAPGRSPDSETAEHARQ